MIPTSRLRWRPPRPAAQPPPNPDVVAPIPAEAQWDEAFLRVESYLRAHQIRSRVILNRLTNEIMAAAREEAEPGEEPPVTVAVRVAHRRIGDWLVHAVGEGDWTDERFRARGRLALLLAGLPKERPDDFLATPDLPPDVKARFAAAELQPGPEIRLSRMPAAPLEFPLHEALDRQWVTFHRSAFARSVGAWLVFAGLASIAWFSTR